MSKYNNNPKNNSNSNDNKKNTKAPYRQKLQDAIEGRLPMEDSRKLLDKISDTENMSFALELAFENKRYDLFNFLIDKIIKPNRHGLFMNPLSQFLVDNIIKDKTELCIAIIEAMVARNINLEERIPLATAAYKGNNKIIETLISKGADLKKKKHFHNYDDSPLIHAISNNKLESAKLIIKAMSERNISFNSLFYQPAPYGGFMTALGTALRRNQMEIAESLIAEGAAIDDYESNLPYANKAIIKTIQSYGSELTEIFYYPKDGLFYKSKKFSESELKIKVDKLISKVEARGHKKYLKTIFSSLHFNRAIILDTLIDNNTPFLLLDFLYTNYSQYFDNINFSLTDCYDNKLSTIAEGLSNKTYKQLSYLFNPSPEIFTILKQYEVPIVLANVVGDYLNPTKERKKESSFQDLSEDDYFEDKEDEKKHQSRSRRNLTSSSSSLHALDYMPENYDNKTADQEERLNEQKEHKEEISPIIGSNNSFLTSSSFDSSYPATIKSSSSAQAVKNGSETESSSINNKPSLSPSNIVNSSTANTTENKKIINQER